MHIKIKTRLFKIILLVTVVAVGVALILFNARNNIVFFYTPSEIPTTLSDKDFRVGGLVVIGSVIKSEDGKIQFAITDGANELTIHYQGTVPGLFKEGQGAIATGRMYENIFIATELLAKHDEKYSPPDLLPKNTEESI